MSDRTDKLTNALLGQAVTLARLEAGEQQRITHRLLPLWSRLRTQVAVDDPTAPPTLPERLRRVKALVALVTQLTTEAFGAIAATHQAVRQDIADWVQHETQRLLQTLGEAALFTRTLTQQALTRVVDAALVFGAPIRDWWARQAATVQQQVGDRLRQGVLQEQPLPRLLQEVDAVQATTTRNTDTLTHGSLASAQQATMTALTEANSARLDGVAWITTLDSRACLRCIALSGQSWTLDHEPLQGSSPWPGEPPLHANCVTGDTLVTPGGRIAAVSKRWYQGEVVLLKTSSKKQLTCTPNHPILTRRGWVPAGLLQEGDEVICSSRQQGVGIANVDIEQMPTSIEKVVASFGLSSGMFTSEVPVASQDFHGDGEGSEVAIINTNCLLRDSNDLAFAKDLMQGDFISRVGINPILLPSQRYLTTSFPGMNTPPNRSMGSLCLKCTLLESHVLPFDRLSLALGARSNTSTEQLPANNITRDMIPCGQVFFGNTGQICSPNILGRQDDFTTTGVVNTTVNQSSMNRINRDIIEFSKSVLGYAFPIQFEQILSINRHSFHGHVFNLQTELGWYDSNGIITHNCRCILSPIPNGEPVPRDQTFDHWLRQQPEAEQRAILGPARFRLWSEGKLKLSRLVDQHHRALTLEQVRSESAA